MPTPRPRHTLTETDELAAALEVAARRWPEDSASRTRLLLRLVEAGQRAVSEDRDGELRRRRAGVEKTAGTLTGVYVLQAAAETGADTVATFDERLARVARSRGLKAL